MKWSERQDSLLRPPGPKPGALLIELQVQKWWEVLVTLQLVTASFVLRHFELRFGRPPWCCPTLAKFWGLDRASWRAACETIVNRKSQIVNELGAAAGNGLPKPYKMDALTCTVRYRER